MKKINLAIFDMDGVLTDTAKIHYMAWKRMFNNHGFEFNYEDYKEKVDGKSRIDGIKSIVGEIGERKIQEMAEEKQKYFLELIEKEDLVAFPDALWLLRHLKENNVKIAVASSSKNTIKILSKIKLLDMFDTVVTGYDFSKGKPDPEIFLITARRLNIEPVECVVFEDAVEGINAGINAGMLTIGVCRDGHYSKLSKAHYIVNRLDKVDINVLTNLYCNFLKDPFLID